MPHIGPTYGSPPRDFLQSVDLALTLTLMLRDQGRITISHAADTLRVSQSTVHRSLAMLVYRGFATRSESRSYLPGPALNASSLRPGLGSELLAAAEPYMHSLSTETRESTHLTVLSGHNTHFLHTVEGTQPVRVGTRQGQVMPATENSGGLIMLAEMSASELRGLYPSMPDTEFDDLRRTLHRARQRGFSINNGLYETDVSAVGACLRNEFGDTLGAITITAPTIRFSSVYHRCAELLVRQVRDLNRTLVNVRPTDFTAERG